MYQRGVGTGSLENTGAGHSRVLGVRSDSCFSQTQMSPSQGDPGHLITAHRRWLSPLRRLSCAESSWDRSRGLHLSPQLPVKLGASRDPVKQVWKGEASHHEMSLLLTTSPPHPHQVGACEMLVELNRAVSKRCPAHNVKGNKQV